MRRRNAGHRFVVERLEDRDAPATLSVGNLAGDLFIVDTAGVVNDMTMSVASGNLIITDATEQFDGTAGFAGASLSNNDKTLSIPLTSLAGADVSIDGAAGNDTLTINALPGFDSGLTIGSPAHPLASVTFAGAVSLPAGKILSVWGGTIAVSAPVSTAGGSIELSAANGITISDAVSSGGGAITLNADSDADGIGRLIFTDAANENWQQQQQLTAADGAAGDWFGNAVALSSDGNTAIVAAYRDGVGSKQIQGTATVFTRSGGIWTQQQQLIAANGAAGDWFGNAVALSGDGNTAIVGASRKRVGVNFQQGTATIFIRTGGVWTEQQQITAADGAANDIFGISVALSSDGNTAIVGASGDDVGANINQGSAAIFTRSGGVWVQQQQITAAEGAAGDSFGLSVALSSDGETAIVTAVNDDVGDNSGQGTATIFTRSGGVWVQQQQITAAGGAAEDNFGRSVALSSDGNTAIVGADDVGDRNIGMAIVFTRSDGLWIERQQITAAGGAADDLFGRSVALSGDGNAAMVAAYSADVGANIDQGAATIFARSNGVWTQQQQITAADGAAGDNFGYKLALSRDGSTAIVGAFWDDIDGKVDQGTATVFTRTDIVIGGSLNAGAGSISIAAASLLPKNHIAQEIFAASASFTSGGDLTIDIADAATFDTLNVAGSVNLAGLDLALTGAYVPVSGDVFNIVAATSRAGFFSNRADGSTFSFNGVPVRIDYTATAVTLTAIAAPVITNIAPFIGPTTGGFTVTITGSNFTGATTVTFGSTAVTIPANASDTTIVVAAPSSGMVGDVNVTVTTPAGTSTPTAFTPGVDQITYLPTKLTGVVVDDGGSQRGSVRLITLNFDAAVQSAPASAFAITDQADNPIAGLIVGVAGVGTSSLTLTFSDASANDLGPVTYGSLADGRYRLKVDGALLTSLGAAVDADGDGQAGGTSTTEFTRLFGDVNGDGFMDALDIYPHLINAIDTLSENPGYNVAFDYDNDGDVDAVDIYPHIITRIDTGV